jgi:polyribonucleotide nucleotidyltransferase
LWWIRKTTRVFYPSSRFGSAGHSEVPFEGPVGAVHIGYIDGKTGSKPNTGRIANSKFRLVIASTRKAVVMMEAGANEVPEAILPMHQAGA